jgi:hypothetical protein
MISPIEVAPASAPGQIKVTRVTQQARKQLVFQLTDDSGKALDLKAEVENPPAEVADWFPQKQAEGGYVKVRLRSQAPGSVLSGGPAFDIEGTILDQEAHRGFVEFQLETGDTPTAGIYECYIERYIPNGDQPNQAGDGWRIDTWPMLLAVEPTAMGLLNEHVNGPLLIPEVRLALLDVDNQNDGAPFSSLLDDTEFTDVDIIFAQRRVVQKWNETPPPVSLYTTNNFPYRYHWLEATTGHLLLMSASRYRRNRLAYQAGGVAIDDQSKADEYERAGQIKLQQFDEWMRNEKYRINMDRCWGVGL